MLLQSKKNRSFYFSILLITLLGSELATAASISAEAKNSTKPLSSNVSASNRVKRPLPIRPPSNGSATNQNRTRQEISERIRVTSVKPTAHVLPKLPTNSSRPITTTKKPLPVKVEVTKAPLMVSTTNIPQKVELKNLALAANHTQNITEAVKLPSLVSELNNTDEFRKEQLNEKNVSQTADTTPLPEISEPNTSTSSNNNNLDFYLDPIQQDDNEAGIHSPPLANMTQGFDSFLINENMNVFTTGENVCPKCKCGVKTLKKVIGGDVTTRNDHPWIALLTYNKQLFCVGSLINNLYVVTAAHCTTTFKKDQIMIHFQDTKRDSEIETEIITRKVSNVYRPRQFSQNTFFNDISLIRLSEPIDISGGLIRPICLPIDKTSFVGKIGTITGWRINHKNNMTMQLSRIINTTVLSNRQCRNTLIGSLIEPTMICSSTSKPNKGKECRGDSGGPLMITQKGRSRLAGVVSWGLGCTKKNGADVFTRTTKFNGWIRALSQDACWCN